jgi:salicylate hydroxylase
MRALSYLIPRAQGAAQAFEDAALLGTLLSADTDVLELPSIFHKFESIRKPRLKVIQDECWNIRNAFGMHNGVDQLRRDTLLAKGLSPGSPIWILDPDFREWLWKYDVARGA